MMKQCVNIDFSIPQMLALSDSSTLTALCGCFPAPGGKPVILAAHNTSATSVRVRWRPLAAAELRGEFQAYLLGYRERHEPAARLRLVRIRDEHTQVSLTPPSDRAYAALWPLDMRFRCV